MPRFPGLPRWPSPIPRRRPRPRTIGLAGLIAALVAGLLWGVGRPSPVTAPEPAPAASHQSAAPAPTHLVPRANAPVPTAASAEGPLSTSDGRTIADPDEVRGIRDSLRAAQHGPPYPFRQDGTSYHNHGRHLPEHEDGWYREFTVVTPAASDRGARRLVIGRDGAVWYTHDHYRSFVRLAVPAP